MPQIYEKMDAEQQKNSLKTAFESMNATCKGKI